MMRILHIAMAFLSLGLVGACFAEWAVITEGGKITRVIHGIDFPIAWMIFGAAILSFLGGMIGAQSGSRSVFVHISCSLLSLIGAILIIMNLMQQRAEFLADAIIADNQNLFQLQPGFFLTVILQMSWFLLALFSMSRKDVEPFQQMKAEKPKI